MSNSSDRGVMRFPTTARAAGFAAMQRKFYDAAATRSPLEVVGNFDSHEAYPYEEYLLRRVGGGTSEARVLDFGCGMGRMIKRIGPRVFRCDGVDLSSTMLEAAERYCSDLSTRPELYESTGLDLGNAPAATYDLVISTITLQHLPVRSVRCGLFREFRRVLRGGGSLALQLAYSYSLVKETSYGVRVHWRDDHFDAQSTNGEVDVVVTHDAVELVAADLADAGFSAIEFSYAPTPHESDYDHWLFVYGDLCSTVYAQSKIDRQAESTEP